MAATPEFAVERPVPAWRKKVARFWRWWSSELLAMVPERFGSLAGSARVPLLALDAGDLVLLEPRAAEGGAPERIALGTLDAQSGRAAVRALLERAGETRGRARLALGHHEALVRRVTMPAATEENLAAVLGFEMDRLTPFRAEEVYFDHRVVARDAQSGSLTVLLAVARRELVEARLEQLRALGVSVQGVAVREETQSSGATLDVLPSTQRGERELPRETFVKQVLIGVVVLLLLAALAIPIVRKNREVHAIKPALDKGYAEARATDDLARELERQVSDYNFLLAKKHAAAPVLAYIEEVTRLLPDNTWLQQLDIKSTGKAREVQVSGETASSSKLIEILEQSTLLQNAAPRGTVTRGSQPGTERFVIAAEARPRPQPEAMPIGEVPVAAAPPAPPVATLQPVSPPPAAAQPAAATPAAAPSPAPAQAPPDLIFKPRGKIAPPPPEAPKPPGR